MQDPASQWVADAVGAGPGERVLDLCAAPGGKATALAAPGAHGGRRRRAPGRAGLVARQRRAPRPRRAGSAVVAADGAPARRCGPASFDRVLVDAPCSGLGTLRRRPDPAGGSSPDAVDRLAALQRRLLDAAADLVRPGRDARVLRVHAHRAPRRSASTSWLRRTRPDAGAARAARRPVAAVGARRARCCPRPPAPTACSCSGTGRHRGRMGGRRATSDDAHGVTARCSSSRRRGAAKVLTVSDGVVAGTREDRSGAALAERLAAAGFEVVERRVVADGVESVADALRELADGFAGLVVTTGGTGFGPRDLTPEGTRAVLDREAPGLAEAMRLVSPLGPAVAGRRRARRRRALVLNTPGSSQRRGRDASTPCSTSSPTPSTSWPAAGPTDRRHVTVGRPDALGR